MRGVWQDLRYGARMLASDRAFTIVAVLTLALGIGANAAIFSVLDPLLLRKLPVSHPDELVQFGMRGSVETLELAEYQFYERYRDANHVFSGVLATSSIASVKATANGASGDASDAIVSTNFFSVLGVQPFAGRFFVKEDGFAGSSSAVISFDYWQSAFHGDASAIGKTVTLGDLAYTIVGIAPPGFFGVRVGSVPDFYLPFAARLSSADSWRAEWVGILARRKTGVTLEQSLTDLQPLFEQNVRESTVPEVEKHEDMSELLISPAPRGIWGVGKRFAMPTRILSGVVALVLLIACANVASLLLARGMARRREITVRVAMGASRSRLVRQLLTESGLLAAMGAAAGLLAGNWASRFLVAALSTKNQPVILHADGSARMIAFTAAVMVATVILCALAPAISATRVDLAQDLKVQSSGGDSAPRGRLAGGLLIAQVGFSVAALIAAGLLLRSLVNLETFDAGFDRDRVVMVSVTGGAASSGPGRSAYYSQLLERINALPGVQSASCAMITPLSDREVGINVTVEGYALKPGETANELFAGVSSGYFRTMGIPLLTGREFTEAEAETRGPVVILNRTMARRFFEDSSPIGKHIQFVEGKHPPMEIVGVVADSKYNDLREKPTEFFYTPAMGGQLAIRSGIPAESIAKEVREAVASIGRDSRVDRVQPLRAQVDQTLHDDYLVTALCGAFSALALVLACVGLYGALAFSVARRTSAIGVRMALGAAPRDIFRLVVAQGMKFTAAGLLLGAAGAALAAPLVESLLFRVKVADPVTLIGVAVLFTAAAILACAIPARRAMRVDPVVALRNE